MERTAKGTYKPGHSGNPHGRPQGALARRTQELREKARKMRCDPIEVMIHEIRDLMKCAAREKPKDDTREEIEAAAWRRRQLRTQAVEVAAKLAPYLHPRLANIELSGNPEHPVEHIHRREAEQLRDADAVEEWRRLAIEGEAKTIN